MRRSVLTLGASVLALATGAAPAAAQVGDPAQQVTDSTGAAQIEAVEVDAPIRVLSDGDNAGDGGSSTAGGQTTGDATGSGQVGPVDADAPVRVLSAGDNGGGSTGASTGAQSVGDGDGSAQIGGGSVTAPIRIASPGDDVVAEAADSDPPATAAPGGTDPAVDAPGSDVSPGDAVPVEQVSPGTIPVADTLPAGDGGDVLPNTATGTGAGDAALGSLPLTGFAAVGALATGLLLLSCGTVARSLAA